MSSVGSGLERKWMIRTPSSPATNLPSGRISPSLEATGGAEYEKFILFSMHQSRNTPFTKKVTFVEKASSVLSRMSTAQERVLPSSHPVTSRSSICLTSRYSCARSKMVLSILSISFRVMLTSVTSLMFLPSVKVCINQPNVIHQTYCPMEGCVWLSLDSLAEDLL